MGRKEKEKRKGGEDRRGEKKIEEYKKNQNHLKLLIPL